MSIHPWKCVSGVNRGNYIMQLGSGVHNIKCKIRSKMSHKNLKMSSITLLNVKNVKLLIRNVKNVTQKS